MLLQQLESGRLDFALLREFPGFELRLPTGVERYTVVESESAYVVMAADHPLAVASRHRGEIDLAALSDEEWIGEPPDDSGFHVLFRAACEQAGFQPKVEHHSVDTSVLMGFVTSGQGVALISPTSYRMLSSDVTTRPLAGDPIHRRLMLAWSTDSPRAQMAADVLPDGDRTRTTRPSPNTPAGASTSACTWPEVLALRLQRAGAHLSGVLERVEVELAGLLGVIHPLPILLTNLLVSARAAAPSPAPRAPGSPVRRSAAQPASPWKQPRVVPPDQPRASGQAQVVWRKQARGVPWGQVQALRWE